MCPLEKANFKFYFFFFIFFPVLLDDVIDDMIFMVNTYAMFILDYIYI